MNKTKRVELVFEEVKGQHPGTGDPMVSFIYKHPEKEGSQISDFVVRATPQGVQIFGTSPQFKNNWELEPLGKVMGLAMKAHVRLALEAPKFPMIPSQ